MPEDFEKLPSRPKPELPDSTATTEEELELGEVRIKSDEVVLEALRDARKTFKPF